MRIVFCVLGAALVLLPALSGARECPYDRLAFELVEVTRDGVEEELGLPPGAVMIMQYGGGDELLLTYHSVGEGQFDVYRREE